MRDEALQEFEATIHGDIVVVRLKGAFVDLRGACNFFCVSAGWNGVCQLKSGAEPGVGSRR
jgi:hypothetical protein